MDNLKHRLEREFPESKYLYRAATPWLASEQSPCNHLLNRSGQEIGSLRVRLLQMTE